MEGPQWTTGSIGRRCKPGNGLSRPVLIGRHEPHTPTRPRTPAPAPERAGAGGEPDPASTTQPRTNPPHPHTRGAGHQGPRTTTPPPSRRPQRAGKRPDPYRTRKLSPPAPMVLPPPGSGRVGHHRNTHQPTGPRGAGAPTGRPPPRGPNPHPHPPHPTAAREKRRGEGGEGRGDAAEQTPLAGTDESRRLLDTDHATGYSDRNLNRIR